MASADYVCCVKCGRKVMYNPDTEERAYCTDCYEKLQAENKDLAEKLNEVRTAGTGLGIQAVDALTELDSVQAENKVLKEEGLKGNIPLVILDQIKLLQAENKRLKGIIYDIGKVTIHHKVAGKTPIQCLKDIRYLAAKALQEKPK